MGQLTHSPRPQISMYTGAVQAWLGCKLQRCLWPGEVTGHARYPTSHVQRHRSLGPQPLSGWPAAPQNPG